MSPDAAKAWADFGKTALLLIVPLLSTFWIQHATVTKTRRDEQVVAVKEVMRAAWKLSVKVDDLYESPDPKAAKDAINDSIQAYGEVAVTNGIYISPEFGRASCEYLKAVGDAADAGEAKDRGGLDRATATMTEALNEMGSEASRMERAWFR